MTNLTPNRGITTPYTDQHALIEPWPITVTNPATGTVLGTLIGGGHLDAIHAIDSAASSMRSWAVLNSQERGLTLHNIANALRTESTNTELAVLITQETGKRLEEARAEVTQSAAYFDWFATAIASRHDQRWEIVPGIRHEVYHNPLGIVGVITPWNFPVSIPARKLAAALAAGCAVVFKPSDQSPFSSLYFAEIVASFLPRGILNTLIGEPKGIADALVSDPRVKGITFTGSTAVGQSLASKCATTMTRCILELGGSAPFIVLDDANIEDAIATLMVAKYRNNGQSCIAANHAWIPQHKFDEFVEAFVIASEALVLGDPLDSHTTLGPLALPTDPDRINVLLAEAERSGATVIRTHPNIPTSGYFSSPAICLSPPIRAQVVSEEVFGPTISILPYNDLDQVLNTIHDLHYGLSGYIATNNVERATNTARLLDIGIIGVNTATPNTPQIPFGGRKFSGIGVEGSQLGLEEFLSYQTVAYAYSSTDKKVH